MDDELIEKAVDKCMWGTFYNSGQSRSGIEAITVHQSLANKFTNLLSKKVHDTFFLDDPSHEHANYGPVFDFDNLLRLEEIVKDATNKGGIVTIGGF